MTTTTAHIASPATAQRDALCVQALRMLRTTAQQWGMCLELPPAPVGVRAQSVARPAVKAVSHCAGLRSWRAAA